MSGRSNCLHKAAMLLALCAGSIAASAPNSPPTGPAVPSWTADPDEQYLLDVNIHQLKIGDPVRAYTTPEGTCVVLGDFLTALDLPMRIDVGARKASGWAFKESNRIAIDYGAGKVSYGTKAEDLAPGAIRETPEGWCVQASALSRWFGIGVKPVTAGSTLVLDSPAKLPVELEMERQQRAAQLHKASFDLSSLPQVRIPYRMWRAPALDFVVSGGVTYRASDGMKVDRQSSVFAAGEIAHLSYDAQVSTNAKGLPTLLRLRAYRSDPDGQLLGPLHATHFAIGDVEGFDSRLTGAAINGRGVLITNRPLTARASFDRTRFEGDLPTGWEAEIYRNGELLGFAKPDANQRYVFDDVQLLYGENRIEIRLYGPQGQTRTREELINVGQDNLPKGKTWYWAGANQPARDIITLEKPPDTSSVPKFQAAVSLEHGIDDRLSVGVLARAMLVGDQRLTFLEGTVRRSIGPALVELGAARESNGGTAAHARMLGKFGGVNVSAEALLANDFHLQGGTIQSVRQGRIALDAPLKLGKMMLPAHVEAAYLGRADGTHELDAAARLSANFDRFNLATDLQLRKQYDRLGAASPPEVTLGLLGSGRVGAVRLRGTGDFTVSPSAHLKDAEVSAYWSATERTDWEGALGYDGDAHRVRARLTHVIRLNTMALALTGEAASDGSVAAGINLNFSLDPHHGLTLSRRPLAEAGIVHALVFRDLNDNGVRDPGEPVEKGALITTGPHPVDQPTDARGSVMVGGLTAYVPVAVGVDVTSLRDPMLVPKQALQVVVPRPGIPAEVQIALVGGGDIEGALIKSAELGFEGVDLELVDAAGKVVGTARTDFDGFFLFERVPYGHYTVQVNSESAAAAKILPQLGVHVEVADGKPVIRLGSIRATPQASLASAEDKAPAAP